MKLVYKSHHLLIDESDFNLLIKYDWKIQTDPRGTQYLVRRYKGKKIYFHREVLEAKEDELIDHKDRNGLNNRRDNLRRSSKSLNLHNTPSRSSTEYKGVYWDKHRKLFKCHLTYKGITVNLGRHTSAEVAATHYDMAVVYLYGEFATLNFPDRLNEYLKQKGEIE
jgi:hypothetical protein